MTWLLYLAPAALCGVAYAAIRACETSAQVDHLISPRLGDAPGWHDDPGEPGDVRPPIVVNPGREEW
ncbi:hypothetical protein [Actinomadura rubrisoli]|uniref:Uncharacterized protein n=1 Tax=Actinomadura rubrisoli TaxID=2530368 RepID=A0A4R5AXW1_9ACTN|nr:hypothetical protein [Actinomadura rubrisoli]TDD77713.1 hypothetical protein E1298_29740 [Actinomadura rubrisoli]